MKIECDKCGAKYSIADDKVRGKTFKIRCKKCSNVIIVRDKAGGGDAAESEAPADEPGWHLAIGGETVGPLTEQEVREKHAAGEIDRETSVWQEGFEDWLPLGDVAAFSDLADRAGAAPAAAAPDPFAGGGDDDYSSSNRGGGGGGYASTPEPAARAPAAVSASPAAQAALASPSAKPAAAAADSPRVSALTSARNENSVLFSLDSLSSMAMGSKGGGGGGGGGASAPSSFSAGGGGGGGGGGGHSPSASGNSEGSGLIDIRSMGAMLGGGGGGGGGGGDDDRDDSMLPSFGGTGFGGLAAAPLLTAAPPVASDVSSAPEPQRQNQTPLYILIGILVLGLGGLAAYVVTRPAPQPQEKIVERIVAPPVQPDKNDDDDDDKPKKKKDPEGEAEAEADAAGDTPGDEKTAVATKPGDKKGTTPKPGDKKGTTPKPGDKKGETTPAAAGDPPAKAEPKPKEDDTPSVECILDPSKCKKGGGGGAATKPPPDASMPEKLELADIKAGVSGPKASAESNCKKHAKGGEKVKIKLSISGPAGTVLSSSAEDDAGNPALGSCVAAELKKASFKKVQKEQIGTVVSVSF